MRRIRIAAHCPIDGRRRGEPRWVRGCEDGEFYRVQAWDNPCGHVDYYEAVVVEAARLAAA